MSTVAKSKLTLTDLPDELLLEIFQSSLKIRPTIQVCRTQTRLMSDFTKCFPALHEAGKIRKLEEFITNLWPWNTSHEELRDQLSDTKIECPGLIRKMKKILDCTPRGDFDMNFYQAIHWIQHGDKFEPEGLGVPLALFTVSRHISAIATEVFYSTNTFQIGGSPAVAHAWLSSIGDSNRRHLRKFHPVIPLSNIFPSRHDNRISRETAFIHFCLRLGVLRRGIATLDQRSRIDTADQSLAAFTLTRRMIESPIMRGLRRLQIELWYTSDMIYADPKEENAHKDQPFIDELKKIALIQDRPLQMSIVIYSDHAGQAQSLSSFGQMQDTMDSLDSLGCQVRLYDFLNKRWLWSSRLALEAQTQFAV